MVAARRGVPHHRRVESGRPKHLHRNQITRCWGSGVAVFRDADTEAEAADGFCVTCRKAYQLSGMSVEEFAAAGPVRQLRRGEVICAVRDCSRPCRNNSITLCQVHDESPQTAEPVGCSSS